ncbi:MAG: AmpG family muropeptide MFS transporter [Calditrichaeota bacterium]|nr:AmpG family muropeptide MFS transporter [Calditrichota bacterium]
MKKNSPSQRIPWIYIPTLYFAEGLPYIIVNSVSVIMYKKMGISNQLIGMTSILYLPWVIKMFWGPAVDIYSTKRNWIILMQLGMGIAFIALSMAVQFQSFFLFTLGGFIIVAFMSATHDIAADGFYMLALDQKQQALFVGVRATFYRLAILFGSGLLVVIAGKVEKNTLNIPLSWTIVLAIAAAVFLGVFLFHRFYLPFPPNDFSRKGESQRAPFLEIFRSYFSQNKIVAIVVFILVYRLGEAVLSKMAAPFLLDQPKAGGLGLQTQTVGYVYGTVGVLSLTVGGLLGGWLISKFGLRRCIWPMALLLKAPDLVYLYMAVAKPALAQIYFLVALEQFGYGFGFTAFMVFLMLTTDEKYKTSHFAISTGIMALGMMLPGMASGFLQNALGYVNFFILVICLTVPGLLVLFFIPLEEKG